MQASRQQTVGLVAETVQQTPVTKRAAPTQLVPELASSSDAANSDSAADDILREIAGMEAEEQARQAAPKGDTAGLARPCQGKLRRRGTDANPTTSSH